MKIYHIALLLCVTALSACITMSIDKPKELQCDPPPPPKCEPRLWTGTAFDTTQKMNQTYLRIRKIRGADSDSNEWRILVEKNGKGLLTTGNALIETEHNVELSPTLLSIEKSTDFPRTVQKTASQSAALSTNISSSPIHARSLPSRTAQIIMGSLKTQGFSTDEWISHPALTPNRRYIFFSSNREGGFGGTDIWFSRIDGDTVYPPQNCGRNINTPCDDICPFISNDGTRLLFSSPGHESIGGYDIMISNISDADISEKSFSKAQNFGAPVNTVFDEIFPTSFGDPKTLLFYASNQTVNNRIPKKDFDMYILREYFSTSDIVPTSPKDIAFEIDIKGVVRNADNLPVNDADITAKNSMTKETITQTKSDKEGNYSLRVPSDKPVEITAQKDNTLYFNEKITVKSEDKYYGKTLDILLPKKIALRINFPNDIANDPYTFILDSNGNETDIPWQAELDLVAENIKKYSTKVKKIELVGHTDDVASDSYNKELALRRVKFIEQELIKRGVMKKILVIKSEGKQMPLKPKNGEDIEIYRKRLRRVELTKLIEE